jgi:hypothetical protein
MVRAQSAPANSRTASDAEREAPRARRLLGHHRRRSNALGPSILGGARLLQVVASSLQSGIEEGLGLDDQAARGLPPRSDASRPLRHAHRSKTMIRRTVCGKSAGTGLWEPREGNLPGPPGMSLLKTLLPSGSCKRSQPIHQWRIGHIFRLGLFSGHLHALLQERTRPPHGGWRSPRRRFEFALRPSKTVALE